MYLSNHRDVVSFIASELKDSGVRIGSAVNLQVKEGGFTKEFDLRWPVEGCVWEVFVREEFSEHSGSLIFVNVVVYEEKPLNLVAGGCDSTWKGSSIGIDVSGWVSLQEEMFSNPFRELKEALDGFNFWEIDIDLL